MLNNEEKKRKKKLDDLKEYGFNFPNNFKPSISFIKIKKEYSKYSRKELSVLSVFVSVAGRIVKKRVMGKSSFFVLRDSEGEIQIYLKEQSDSVKLYETFTKQLDLGDILGVKGTLFKTYTKELSIYCSQLTLLVKSLKALPNKFHGLSNKEIRYRQRYLDLISNKELCYIFKLRSNILNNIREFMKDNDFLEVETPMMQTIPGGASARPFITYHNSLDRSLYLRISPELYLKRLIIGGFNRIFEINKSFRNEGISIRHNPEFTMMEVYVAYSDYNDMISLTEKFLKFIVKKIIGFTVIKYGSHSINFEKKFSRYTLQEAILKFNPNIKLADFNNFKRIKSIAETIGISINTEWSINRLIVEIFNKTVEPYLIQPTFITDYPIEVSPLARRNDSNTSVADRFELFISGLEIANGFSELNDVYDQKARFLVQVKNKNIENDDEEYYFYDDDYITALKYGLPPTAGLGIGIDRLIMLLTNQNNIRDVIFFPILKSLNR